MIDGNWIFLMSLSKWLILIFVPFVGFLALTIRQSKQKSLGRVLLSFIFFFLITITWILVTPVLGFGKSFSNHPQTSSFYGLLFQVFKNHVLLWAYLLFGTLLSAIVITKIVYKLQSLILPLILYMAYLGLTFLIFIPKPIYSARLIELPQSAFDKVFYYYPGTIGYPAYASIGFKTTDSKAEVLHFYINSLKKNNLCLGSDFELFCVTEEKLVDELKTDKTNWPTWPRKIMFSKANQVVSKYGSLGIFTAEDGTISV